MKFSFRAPARGALRSDFALQFPVEPFQYFNNFIAAVEDKVKKRAETLHKPIDSSS